MKFKENCLKIKDTNIHYLQEGVGEPVILIHGGNSTAYSAWEHNISSLSEKAKIFSIDLPGFGKSDKPKLDYSTEKFVEFIEEFTEKKDLRNYTVIGNSMGGAIAFDLAAKSNNVKKLGLVDSYGLNKRYKYIQKPVYLFLNIPYLIDGIGWNLQKLIDRHWVEWAFFKWLKDDWGSKKLKTNIIDLKEQIESPILVIHGEKDRIVPFESSKDTCKLLKDCDFTPMEGCGHLPQKDEPKKFNKIIKDFL